MTYAQTPGTVPQFTVWLYDISKKKRILKKKHPRIARVVPKLRNQKKKQSKEY